MEHRWGQRMPRGLAVHLTSAGASGAGVLRDASISGGFIETAVKLPPLAHVGVVVLVGMGAARRAVELPACVTRSTVEGLGVEWRDMACEPLLALLLTTGRDMAHLTSRDRVFN
jgi:hypothetical protein